MFYIHLLFIFSILVHLQNKHEHKIQSGGVAQWSVCLTSRWSVLSLRTHERLLLFPWANLNPHCLVMVSLHYHILILIDFITYGWKKQKNLKVQEFHESIKHASILRVVEFCMYFISYMHYKYLIWLLIVNCQWQCWYI